MRMFLGLISIVMLSACGDSKFADISGSELQDRYSRCENADSLSPGGAITCDNIRRECERRADEKGRRVCY
ncbi:hypothetical protein [Ketobacter alkanivorans]|uniref:Lipoprotein n=1 Tax=Ketobacter alkanivorans TaxID=1917421 RepID=A0A2K9LGV5_9GAMM|nr:hypothetical protein [Ketobacter alkanivorans]AUM11473.1 hypothetical protein Kalk_03110 [Ketobacter alkanivorans]MCP5019544.1 hypothetical protein [Ketobacter sp.]